MGEIRFVRMANLITRVEGDTNADGNADFGFFVQCVGRQILGAGLML
jgi:hypothetical protein